jgi:hypothetical protein
MRTRFSVSARWAFSCASWECRWAYWRVLLEALLVAVGFDDVVVVAAAKDEGLADGWWEVEGAIWHLPEVGLEDGGNDYVVGERGESWA